MFPGSFHESASWLPIGKATLIQGAGLDFFELTVAPNVWTRNRAGTKFVHTAQTAARAKITIKVDRAPRTLSLTGKKMTLPGPDAAIPEARIGLGFGDFVKINAVILQARTAKSGATTFPY